MNAEPRDGWMQTYTGGMFYPTDPRIEDIRFEDIANALSKMCRYGGHCIRFLSVAEHSVHVASMASAPLKLTALMHDASEAYAVDVPRPLKRQLIGYKAIETRLEELIATKFNLWYPFPDEIHHLDDSIIADERDQNMAQPPRPWSPRTPLGITLKFWTPQQASYEFTTAFYRYGGKP